MNKQINQHQQFLRLATIAAIFSFGAFGSTFAQGVGAKYGARDPRTCADKTQPKNGALSAAKAAEYVICENEVVWSEYLFFVDAVKVQIGAARRYNPAEDYNFSGIDTRFPVYPIRGSYKSYQCTKIFPDKTNTDRNCNLTDNPNAEGACYKKKGFGEWRCMFADIHGEVVEDHIPPPGAARQKTAPADKNDGDNQNIEQQAETKPAGKNVQTKAAPPAPDFSEMEDWFEIVRYEYPKAPDRTMWIYFKPKVDGGKRPIIFYVEFRDKDGILVQSADASPMCCSDALMMTANGETAKVRVQLPSESIMKQVTSVKVIRAGK